MRRDLAIETLLDTTDRMLRLGKESCGGIAGAIYLFLCSAYEAHLSPDAICRLLGTDDDCILNRADLEDVDEELALEAYSAFDGLLREQFSGRVTPSSPASSTQAL